jgi:hypothetical protein
MAWRWDVDPHGHPLALHLARGELEGSPDQRLSVADWRNRKERHTRTLRSLGVVVAPADGSTSTPCQASCRASIHTPAEHRLSWVVIPTG